MVGFSRQLRGCLLPRWGGGAFRDGWLQSATSWVPASSCWGPFESIGFSDARHLLPGGGVLLAGGAPSPVPVKLNSSFIWLAREACEFAAQVGHLFCREAACSEPLNLVEESLCTITCSRES